MDHSFGYGSEQRLREQNEDCYGVFDFPEYTLAVVCDGMGGHVGGAHASTLAVRTMHDTMRELQSRPVAVALEEAIQRTNLVIYEAARKNHRLTGMGTTIVAAVILRDQAIVAHVGDSRAYLLRRGQVQALTRDHTMVNLFVDAELLSPEDAATHPEAHVLSRSLGVERQVEVDVSDAIQLEAGDVVFLCSDGVHGVVTDWELGNVDWSTPNDATREVLRIVGSREGDDNATAVSVLMGSTVEDVPPTPVPDPRRFDEGIGVGGSGMTAVPADEDLEMEPLAETPYSGQQSGGSAGSYAVYDDPILEPDPEERRQEPQRPSHPPVQSRESTPAPVPDSRKPRPASAPKPKPAAPPARTRGLVPVAVAAVTATVAMMCVIGVLLVFVWWKAGTSGPQAGLVPAPAAPTARVDPVAPSPVEPREPQPLAPDDQWSQAQKLEKDGDFAAAASLLRELVATGDQHPFGDRALLELASVQRQRMARAGHAADGKPVDAPVEQKLQGGVEVFGLTDDRRAFVDAANAVLSHTFAPPKDPSAPNLAKVADDQRPTLLLQLGQLMCNHHRYDEARTRLRELEDLHRDSKQAAEARKLPSQCRQADPGEEAIYACPTGGFLIRDELPTPPRRLPRNSLYCNQPPPGGRFQQEAIQRQRAKDCAGSLTAVQQGMKISEDHCRLYTLAWNCFYDNNLRELEKETDPLRGWDDLVLVLPMLEGSRDLREAQASDPALGKLPGWFRDAPAGLEFRLETWSKDPKMQEATTDLFGAPTVADQLTKDLFLEARIGVELACLPPQERTSKVAIEQAWARRVYVLARALHGPAGVLIKQEREDIQPVLRSMLARSVADFVDEQGRRTPIPDVVREAYDVGIGNRPPPTGQRPQRDVITEPVIEDDPEVPRVQISRGAGQ